MDRSWN